MRLIDELTAADYLRDTGRIALHEVVRVRELGGGVSNMVLLVERPSLPGQDLVLKQGRAQLRTRLPWFSSLERIWREADVLATCTRLIGAAEPVNGPADTFRPRTPRIVFEDRDNYLFAMEPAPQPNVVWKSELLAGRTSPAIATACGHLLGTLHAQSWHDPQIARELSDRTLFDQLRVDPYYRTLAANPDVPRIAIERLIDSLAANPCALVHADFSPKNLLAFADGLMMVDFETGHFGDPAFDLGFFLAHLVLKACYHAPRHTQFLALTEQFQNAYDEIVSRRLSAAEHASLWARGVQNFAGCAWARLDGKSPVEYLTDERRRAILRALCRAILETQPSAWSDVVSLCQFAFDEISPAPTTPEQSTHQ